MLLPLLDDLFKVHRGKPTPEWRTQFHTYLRTMPPYYASPLRRALTRMGVGTLAVNLIPEAIDSSILSYSVQNYLKRLKNQAKTEYDRIVSMTPHKGKFGPDGIKVVQKSSHKLMETLTGSSLREAVTDFPGYMLALPGQRNIESHPLRNPFDIPRARLLDQLVRMRANLIGGGRGRTGVVLVDSDTRHSLPISSMGNYQDYLKKQPTPLRELESQPVRQHMFGNPFKINKNMMMADEVSGIVDEVQVVGVGGVAGQAAGHRGVKRPITDPQLGLVPPKRRKGALPKDFQYQSPNSSPAHCPEYPTPPASPAPPPASVCPPAPPRPQTNGVTVAGGVGPVYSSGKMAAFKSFEADLVSNSQDDVLIIAEHQNTEPLDKNEEPVVDVPAVNDNNVQTALRSVDNIPSEAQQKIIPPAPTLTNGDHEGVEKKPVVKNHVENHVNDKKSVKLVDSLTSDEIRSIKLRNNNVRQLIYKEVKKPGKSHGELWEMLANLHGPAYIKQQFIQEVRLEAIRFVYFKNISESISLNQNSQIDLLETY